MCFICDGGTEDELQQLVEQHIDQYGWHLSAVDPGGGRGLWMYTIGLTERYGHPELIVTDACCEQCIGGLLNQLGEQVKGGRTCSIGDEAVSADGHGRARFGAVHPRQWQTDRFNRWRSYYGEKPWTTPEPMAFQVITQGLSGRWQDDPASKRWRHHRLDRSPHLAGAPARFRH